MKKENKFYSLSTSTSKYIYECFSRKVFKVSDDIYKKLTLNDFSDENLSERDKIVLNFLSSIPAPQALMPNQKRCCITINFSNRCNLGCKYCFRNQNDSSKLSKQDLREIIDFAVTRYMPDASEYPFSVDFSSEPFMDFDLLKEIDDIFADYEGYLLTENDFHNISIEDFWQFFPEVLQEKYSCVLTSKGYLPAINTILKTENLSIYWGPPKDEYAQNILNYTKILSHSKAAFINRLILDERFYGIIKKNDVMKYFSFYFMSNGSILRQEHVDFIKSIYMTDFTISIDGFEMVEDFNRPYKNEKSSFSDTLHGIKLLQKNGVKVNVSSVITPHYMNLINLIDFFRSIHVSGFSFNPARSVKNGFDLETMKEFINELQCVYDEVKKSIIKNDYSLVYFLRYTKLFDAIKNIVAGGLVLNRCQWGEKVTIDSHGDLYHCDYTYGVEPKIGNYRDNVTFSDVIDNKSVDNNEKCYECWAKYLCGGTCYYMTLKTRKSIDEAECMYRKALIEQSLNLYVWLIEHRNLQRFLDALEGKL